MAIGALHHGRAVLKTAVADSGITDESWVAGLRGWFESFVEGLASGPPALRAAQLAALARAGVVRFVGPDPKFGVDREAGLHRGLAVGRRRRRRGSTHAWSRPWRRPTGWPSTSRRCWNSCWPRGWCGRDLMMTVEGTPVQTSGLDVRPHPYRPLGANGVRDGGLYVLGLQLSAAQWGTAIAAEARPAGRSRLPQRPAHPARRRRDRPRHPRPGPQHFRSSRRRSGTLPQRPDSDTTLWPHKEMPAAASREAAGRHLLGECAYRAPCPPVSASAGAALSRVRHES